MERFNELIFILNCILKNLLEQTGTGQVLNAERPGFFTQEYG
jgi:hypothetical protein